jgi:acetyl-CoA carboxylase biotin carboxyl carrier protein
MQYELRKRNMPMAQKDIDLKKIKELIEIMKQNNLEELEIRQDDDKIYLKRCQPQPPAGTTLPIMKQEIGTAPAGPGSTEALGRPGVEHSVVQQENLVEITSPIVGTFYAKPSPDSDPYVEIGSTVGPQTIVCIIEAMKVMNEIKAETSGTITDVLVTDGQAVEYGQVLFRVRPD